MHFIVGVTKVRGRDKEVIVLCSDRFKTSTDAANPRRCKSLTGIVKSKVFITSLKGVFSGTRGRSSNLPRRAIYLSFILLKSGVEASS
jgi:hypothetical protein